MLNRTNRTLSANLNRLNLGTRSLANLAGVNTGDKTLRTRHVHRVVLRDEMRGYQSMPMIIGQESIPPISSSSSVPPWHVPSSPVVRRRVDVAAVSFPQADRHCQFGEFQGHAPEHLWQQQECSKRNGIPLKGLRLLSGDDLGSRLARATLATTAAAATAAAGG